jgi:hypothetical protein
LARTTWFRGPHGRPRRVGPNRPAAAPAPIPEPEPAPEPEPEPVTETTYSWGDLKARSKDELVALAEERGLDAEGTRFELMGRLRDA